MKKGDRVDTPFGPAVITEIGELYVQLDWGNYFRRYEFVDMLKAYISKKRKARKVELAVA